MIEGKCKYGRFIIEYRRLTTDSPAIKNLYQKAIVDHISPSDGPTDVAIANRMMAGLKWDVLKVENPEEDQEGPN